MSELNGLLDEFSDWKTVTGTFYELTTGLDSQGRPTETWVSRYANESVNFWTDNSLETNANEKFVNNAVGKMLVRASLPITNKYKFTVGTVDYFITGYDDIGGFGEMKVLGWKREY